MDAAKRTRHDEEGISMKDMHELEDDEVVSGRLQQVSEQAWEKDGDASEEEVDKKLMDGAVFRTTSRCTWCGRSCHRMSSSGYGRCVRSGTRVRCRDWRQSRTS